MPKINQILRTLRGNNIIIKKVLETNGIKGYTDFSLSDFHLKLAHLYIKDTLIRSGLPALN